MRRFILVGGRSFIAGHVREAAIKIGAEVVSFAHDAHFSPSLRSSDLVINFSLDPAYLSEPYAREKDCDLRTATACRVAGARFIMLSTRRVYSASDRWGAHETSPAVGDETFYGQNKARTEAAIMDALQGDVAILRMSNIFGFEFDPAGKRRTFFAQALKSLRQSGKIVLDMNPATRRDFLPVELCAQAIAQCASQQLTGIYNIGCGFPLECGAVGQWIIDGYGGGSLVATGSDVRDEFYLRMDKWQSRFNALIDIESLRNRCMELGRRLR